MSPNTARVLRALFFVYVAVTVLHIAYVVNHEPFAFDAWNVAHDTGAKPASISRFFEFWPEGSGIASSGDLAYTYGWSQRFVSADGAPADTGAYLHVWRQEGPRAWKLALAVWNPLRAK